MEVNTYSLPLQPRLSYLIGERAKRASEASETLLLVVQWKTRYVYTYIYIYRYVRHTFVARSWGDVMWEELSVGYF